MKPKVFIGSAMAVTLMGVGILAGSVVGANSAAAQTPSVTPQATSTPKAATTPGTTSPQPGLREGLGGPGRGGHGHGGFDGGFDRGLGANATAEGATQAISNVTSLITLVKSDLTYATGKMDTADVQRWINGADALLKSARDANTASQFGKAIAYAQAARELASAADGQMAQELGASTLPSYSQRPQGRGPDPSTSTATITQAQASRLLAETYNRLVAQATQVTGASNAAEASPYLTDAQDAYKAAYDAYQAGNYNDAVSSSRLAGKLAGVAASIVRASTAPANADTPVTVPAPNF